MNQAVDLDELTLFHDMARRAFEKEISPYCEEWEHNHMVPRELWNALDKLAYCAPTLTRRMAVRGLRPT